MTCPVALESTRACSLALSALYTGDSQQMLCWVRDHLHKRVLPFWIEHAIDPKGGLFTCLADDGRVLSDEKWMWSQWRAVWIFSRFFRKCGGEEYWLELAGKMMNFCAGSGWDEASHGWALLLDRNGRILRGNESIYTDAFAVDALQEYYRASGDSNALELAVKTAEAALEKLARPRDTLPHFPYPIPPGSKPHGVPMIWSLVLARLGAITDDRRFLDTAATMADEIFHDFYRPQRDLVLEFVGAGGEELTSPEGTAVVPGHVIEDMWFQLHLSVLPGQRTDRREECLRLLLRHLEIGWDDKLGGIQLAIDADGRNEVGWGFANSKLWWPHTEALYAVLLGWEITGQVVFLDWYKKLWEICLEHYVDWVHGEWRQKLDQQFRPLADTVALPVKDPFHLPRSLLLQIELLQRVSRRQDVSLTDTRTIEQ